MPISHQEQAELICPSCGADFSAAIWLILDAQEQPAELEQLRSGTLNSVTCPHCGSSGPAGAPLLFHDAQARRVIFAGAPGAAEHEVRDQARDLHAILVGSIPEEQRRPYLADVDVAQDIDGVAHMLRRIERRRGAPAPTRDSQPPTPEEPPLLLAVQELLAAGSPEELERVLADHPLLLAPATDLTLAQLADVAVEQRAYDIADSLQQARHLLAQMGAAVEPEAPPAAAIPPGPPDTAEPAIQALMQAQSTPELLDAVGVYPLLLRPEIDELLAEQIDQALDAGHDRLAGELEDRREALAGLRATRAAPDADEPTIEEAIEALLIAEGEEAMAATIDRYPLLLEDVAAQALWQFASEARAGGDEELARYAIECREMLRRVRDELDG